jgi:hypothetical protein
MARVIGKALIAFAVIAALLIIAALVITLREPKFTPVAMPNANGYGDLVKAREMVASLSLLGTRQAGTNKLATRVAQDAEALRLARAALARECRVPFEDSSRNLARLASPPPHFQILEMAFRYEGRLAEVENRPADAAQSYLAMTRIGQEMTRGGAVIYALVASSIEERGLMKLGTNASRSSPRSTRRTPNARRSRMSFIRRRYGGVARTAGDITCTPS